MYLRTGRNNAFVNLQRSAEPGRGSVVFTGPDASRDYRSKLPDFPYYIGESDLSAERTGDLNYLYRSPPNVSYQQSKQSYVGEIGWGLCLGEKLNKSTLLSGMQIKLAEFRQRVEDRVTHRYQNPWQPPPAVLDRQRDGRAFLAWPLRRIKEPKEGVWHKRTAASPIEKTESATLYGIQDDDREQSCEEEVDIPFNLEEQPVSSNP
ncbi:protein SPMIP2 [Heptranchias perlo]|uniref:protein SPMIP2 n=1 Tax=Heptranchias perlo TaxID=212740 RepID=UPI00355A8BEC